MENVKNVENVKIREDLNKIISKVRFEEVGSKNYKRMACIATIDPNLSKSGKTIEFREKDNAGLFDLLVSYYEMGEKDPVESVKLVEDFKKNLKSQSFLSDDEEDDSSELYISLLYTLKDGSKFRLFPARGRIDKGIINNYYAKMKALQEEQKTAPKQITQTK